MKGQVSVIIPNFNKKPWLAACFNSCLEQGPWLKEMIVVDDHSDDGSWDVITSFRDKHPDVVQVFRNPGKGANEARDFGFEKSSGDYIQWLDSDDELKPGKFEAQIRLLQDSGADIAYSDWQINYYVRDHLIRTEVKKYKPYEDFLCELIIDNWTSPNNYLITRSMATQLSRGIGWNPDTLVGQDREYFTMAGILGAGFVYATGVYAVYNKQDSNSISGMDFRRRLELNQILENRFRREIDGSSWIPDRRKKNYHEILNTHLVKACFYHPGIRLQRFIHPFRLKWKLMHWKMRLAMPWILFSRNLQLIYR